MAARDTRQSGLAKIHIAKAQLGLDEETYRGMLRTVGGVESASQLDAAGLRAVLDHLQARGWRPRKRALHNAADWRKPRIAKITALWCVLADAGVVHDRGEAAMLKFCARITHKARLEWARSEDLSNCIQALRAWARRQGVELDE